MQNGYMNLVMDTFGIQEACFGKVAQVIKPSDVVVIDSALAEMKVGVYPDRHRAMVRMRFGLDGEPLTFREVGQQVIPSVSTERARQIVSKFLREMRINMTLKPIVMLLHEKGIEMRYGSFLVRKPEQQTVRSLLDLTGTTEKFSGIFLLNCLPTCTKSDPCPSCQAKDIVPADLLSRVMQLAEQWRIGPPNTWRSKSVKDMGFSIRTESCLTNNKIKTLGQLAEKSEAELLRMPYFGRKSLNEIKHFFGEYGLTMRAWF